jgi:hypothetical protein
MIYQFRYPPNYIKTLRSVSIHLHYFYLKETKDATYACIVPI